MLAKECLAEFKLDCELRRLSNRTVKGYINNCALCLNFLEREHGIINLEDIRPLHLIAYFQYLINKGLSPSYANGVLKSVRAFFKYVTWEGYISENVALKVRWQKEGKFLINTFSDEEVKKLLNAFKDPNYLAIRNKLILAIAFDTGARNSEICDITCSYIRHRGVEDIFIACTDNLTGFSAAIEASFPRTEIQNCIIHQLRNSSKYVSYKDLKALMADLKEVYAAVDEAAALDALDRFADRWDKKYPKIAQSWRDNWPNLSTYFKYPQEIRRLIYTTNTIEGFNRQLRKVTKAKTIFPTDDSLLKMLYLAMMDITKKWTGRRQDWSMIHAQMAVYFEDRMPD